MKIIQIRPSKRFSGAWTSFEAPRVEPAFSGRSAKSDAIDYACQRFGGGAGEVRVYEESGNIVERKVLVMVATNILGVGGD